MEEITTLGIDLAKRVFASHGVNARGRVVLRRVCRRDELVGIVAQLSPCLVKEIGATEGSWRKK